MSILRACPSCGRSNRIPARHIADPARCGQCKQPLPPLAEPVEADAALFDAVVSEARVPVLVDFWASWCQPCRMAAPEVAARFQVQGIPNFVVLRNGRVVKQEAGVRPRAEMRRWLEAA